MTWILLAAVAFAQDTLHQQLQKKARVVFDREMAREKAGICPNAMTTYEVNECFGQEIAATTANFNQFAASIRALLAPRNDGTVKQVDDVTAIWEKYRDAQCSAAFDLFKGGTIAPTMLLGCRLNLLRSRMRELDAAYSGPLRN